MVHTVTFLPSGATQAVPDGTTLLEAARLAGLSPDAPCGGHGTCGKCTIRLLRQGAWQTALACQTLVDQDLTVSLPNAAAGEVILTSGQGKRWPVASHLQQISLTMQPATAARPTALWDRLSEALADSLNFCPEPPVSLSVTDSLWQSQKKGSTVWAVLLGQQVLHVSPVPLPLYCAAVDIGTTTLAAYVMNGQTGDLLAVASAMNPQREYGADVISRIQYAMDVGLDALTRSVRTAVDGLLAQASEELGISPTDIALLCVAGNTCMHHLYLGIQPDALADPPYMPVLRDALILPAEGLAAIAPWGRVLALPNIAGFVGADTVGCVLSTGLDQQEALTLLLDIGTNGEMVLGNRDRMVACSTAAGPALEGAKIHCGMRGAAGAIDHVWLEDGALAYSVIGGGAPQGICGSGLLDAVAVLLETGVLTPDGRFQDPKEVAHPAAAGRLGTLDRQKCFYFINEGQTQVLLCQKDIRELQLAKGAIAAGIGLMAARLGVDVSEIQQVWIAGAFGTFIRPKSACAIGMLPSVLESRITAVGNAAGEGAKAAALSRDVFAHASAVKDRIEFLELASLPDFQDCFVDNLGFPGDPDDEE